MAHQLSVGKNLNKKLKVFSNKKLMVIARDMLYHASTAYLKTEVKIEKENKRVYVLHYHYNLIEEDSADCGPRETRNIRFSYFNPEFPGKEFYSNGSECLFFDDPELLNDFSDVYKMLLLKKYTLLSFICEYRFITNYNKNSLDIIVDQLKKVEDELLFRFNNVFTVYGYYDDNDAQDYIEFHKSDYPVKSIEYKSNYTAWDSRFFKDTKVETELTENQLKLELKPLSQEETEETEETDFQDPKYVQNYDESQLKPIQITLMPNIKE